MHNLKWFLMFGVVLSSGPILTFLGGGGGGLRARKMHACTQPARTACGHLCRQASAACLAGGRSTRPTSSLCVSVHWRAQLRPEAAYRCGRGMDAGLVRRRGGGGSAADEKRGPAADKR